MQEKKTEMKQQKQRIFPNNPLRCGLSLKFVDHLLLLTANLSHVSRATGKPASEVRRWGSIRVSVWSTWWFRV